MAKRLVLMVLVAIAVMCSGCAGTHDLTQREFQYNNASVPEIAFNIKAVELEHGGGGHEGVKVNGKSEMMKGLVTVFSDKSIAFDTQNAKTVVEIIPTEIDLGLKFYRYTMFATATVSANGQKNELRGDAPDLTRGLFGVVINKEETAGMVDQTFVDLAKKIRSFLGM